MRNAPLTGQKCGLQRSFMQLLRGVPGPPGAAQRLGLAGLEAVERSAHPGHAPPLQCRKGGSRPPPNQPPLSTCESLRMQQ